MDWSGADYLWCFYQLFGLSFWWHPFTAEWASDVMPNFSKSVQMKTNSSTSCMAWGWVNCKQIYSCDYLTILCLCALFLLENIIGVQMRVTSFSDLRESGNIETVLDKVSCTYYRMWHFFSANCGANRRFKNIWSYFSYNRSWPSTVCQAASNWT